MTPRAVARWAARHPVDPMDCPICRPVEVARRRRNFGVLQRIVAASRGVGEAKPTARAAVPDPAGT